MWEGVEATINGIPTASPLPNDTLVTQESGRGVGTFKQLVDRLGEELYTGIDANHASIASAEFAGCGLSDYGVVDFVVNAERYHGDLKDD